MGLIAPQGVFLHDQSYHTFKVTQNGTFDTLDVEMAAGDGLPVVRTDTSFTGAFTYAEVIGGQVQLMQFYQWADSVVRDDATVLDDATLFDDTMGGETMLDYLIGTTATIGFYEGAGVFASTPYALVKAGRVNSDVINLTSSAPANTTIVVEVSISMDTGLSWGDWTTVTDGGNLVSAGTDVRQWLVKYRVTLQTTDPDATSALSQYRHTLNSLTLYRMDSAGVMRTYNGTTGTLTPVAI